MSELKPCPMTADEAITVLERLAHTESKWPGTEDTLEALDVAVEALRRAQPENEPLTLEQLREMDGEPVWCTDGEGHSCYCIVNSKSADCTDNEAGAWCFEFYGMPGDGKNGLHPMGWIAYRRKPERSENDG